LILPACRGLGPGPRTLRAGRPAPERGRDDKEKDQQGSHASPRLHVATMDYACASAACEEMVGSVPDPRKPVLARAARQPRSRRYGSATSTGRNHPPPPLGPSISPGIPLRVATSFWWWYPDPRTPLAGRPAPASNGGPRPPRLLFCYFN